MAAGTTYKQCGCRDGRGKRLGQQCPKLRRRDGAWSRDHSTWYYQLELPPGPGGTRRAPLRRGGFPGQATAQHELERARDLLAIAAPRDTATRTRIADAICRALKATKELPGPAVIRKLARTGHDFTTPPTVGE